MPWPPDAPAPPPLDATVYELEHRTVDGTALGAWEPVLTDETGTSHWTLGSRDETVSDHAVTPGGDLLDPFPEPGAGAIGAGLDVHWLDVFDLASPTGDVVRPVPAPGTFHQYRVRTIDAIGRPSDDWRETNVLRLEKHVPPPLPSAPSIPPVGGHDTPQPTGVFARALVKDAPDLTAADLALLGADDDAVVLSWGWHEQQRDQDPFAARVPRLPRRPPTRPHASHHHLRRARGHGPLRADGGHSLAADRGRAGRHLGARRLSVPSHVQHGRRLGAPATIDVEANVPSPGGALPVPSLGPLELTLRLSPTRVRPQGWTAASRPCPHRRGHCVPVGLPQRAASQRDAAVESHLGRGERGGRPGLRRRSARSRRDATRERERHRCGVRRGLATTDGRCSMCRRHSRKSRSCSLRR